MANPAKQFKRDQPQWHGPIDESTLTQSAEEPGDEGVKDEKQPVPESPAPTGARRRVRWGSRQTHAPASKVRSYGNRPGENLTDRSSD
jgi:hypothetical protein